MEQTRLQAGWTSQSIGKRSPWCTIGLTQVQHPEILLTGRNMAETHAIPSLLAHRVRHWADEEGLFPWQREVTDVLTQPLHETPPALRPKPG
ncbi:hypothetical protein [Arthrobacter sp.]|uniref:hypothetical protein n=1 Tax=Arthrobacter sp. TaxID=1667 RepID=UPI003392365D